MSYMPPETVQFIKANVAVSIRKKHVRLVSRDGKAATLYINPEYCESLIVRMAAALDKFRSGGQS